MFDERSLDSLLLSDNNLKGRRVNWFGDVQGKSLGFVRGTMAQC